MSEKHSDSAILDKGAELFADAVESEELMDMYFRGLIGPLDLADRLTYLKNHYEVTAHDALDRENGESFERVDGAQESA